MGPEKALVGGALPPERAECSGTLSVKQLVGVAPELFFYARSGILGKRLRGGGEGSVSLRRYPSRFRRQAPTTPSKPVPSKTKQMSEMMGKMFSMMKDMGHAGRQHENEVQCHEM